MKFKPYRPKYINPHYNQYSGHKTPLQLWYWHQQFDVFHISWFNEDPSPQESWNDHKILARPLGKSSSYIRIHLSQDEKYLLFKGFFTISLRDRRSLYTKKLLSVTKKKKVEERFLASLLSGISSGRSNISVIPIKIVDQELAPQRQEWTPEYFENMSIFINQFTLH